MLERLLDGLFGCWHDNYTFPMTIRPHPARRGSLRLGTYVVCLQCGKELAYDWNRMRVTNSFSLANSSQQRDPEAMCVPSSCPS
jgi:hypothetical protein